MDWHVGQEVIVTGDEGDVDHDLTPWQVYRITELNVGEREACAPTDCVQVAVPDRPLHTRNVHVIDLLPVPPPLNDITQIEQFLLEG